MVRKKEIGFIWRITYPSMVNTIDYEFTKIETLLLSTWYLHCPSLIPQRNTLFALIHSFTVSSDTQSILSSFIVPIITSLIFFINQTGLKIKIFFLCNIISVVNFYLKKKKMCVSSLFGTVKLLQFSSKVSRSTGK